jgi:hypothetical protein
MQESLAELAVSGSDPRSNEHVRSCAECAREIEEYQKTLAFLDAAPDLTVPDRVWRNVQNAVTPVRWMRKAASLAAALLLGAFLAYAIIGRGSFHAVVSHADPGSPLAVGTGVDRVDTSHYLELRIPETGLLRVRAGSALNVIDAHTVSLERGELFAEIDRGPFTVRTPRSDAAVVGTKFGVRLADGELTVYTMEGKVDVGGLPVAAGQRLINTSFDNNPCEETDWFARRTAADPTLAAEIRATTIHIEMTGAALLPDLGDFSQHLSLEVQPVGRDPFTVTLTAAPHGHRRRDGRFQIDRFHPLTVEADLRPLLEPGVYHVRPVFTVNSVDGDTWTGMIKAPSPLRLEVP